MNWTFELTRERVDDLTHRFEWALQYQNARFARGMRAMRKRFVTILCAVGFVLLALLYAMDPALVRTQPVMFGGMLAAFVVAALVVRVQKDKPRKVHYVGRMLARTAARTYRKPGQQVPYTIDYSCDGEVMRARVDKLGLTRAFKLRAAHLVLHADTVAFVYRFRWSLRPMRFVYATGADLRALLDAFERAGVPHEALAGPTEGYVAPIAEARVSNR